MSETASRLRRDAIAIWQAGVAAVDSERLVRERVHFAGRRLEVAGHAFEVNPDQPDRRGWRGQGRGRHGRGPGSGPGRYSRLQPRLTGWVNVPADCVRPLPHIHLHAARPAALNEPTEAGVVGIANDFATG